MDCLLEQTLTWLKDCRLELRLLVEAGTLQPCFSWGCWMETLSLASSQSWTEAHTGQGMTSHRNHHPPTFSLNFFLENYQNCCRGLQLPLLYCCCLYVSTVKVKTRLSSSDVWAVYIPGTGCRTVSVRTTGGGVELEWSRVSDGQRPGCWWQQLESWEHLVFPISLCKIENVGLF